MPIQNARKARLKVEVKFHMFPFEVHDGQTTEVVLPVGKEVLVEMQEHAWNDGPNFVLHVPEHHRKMGIKKAQFEWLPDAPIIADNE